MQFGVRRVAALVAVVLATAGVSISDAAALGKQCYSNSDCGDGSFCVAGDSQTSVQRCVAGTPCGGKISGACPGDEQSGQLACIWRPDSETCAKSPSGCLELDGDLGIYKCISIARCDQYLAGQCSASCNVNGKQCNGRGTCQLSGGSASKPKFECACDSGWNGTRCDGVVDDSCVVDVGQCGDHGTCVKNACTCKDGYTGVQCQIPPKSKSGSGSGATKTPTPTPTNKSTSSPNSSASKANSGDVVTSKKKGPSALVIIIAVLVALIVVGAIVFVVLARKRRRQQEAADNSGFNRTDSVLAGGEARTGPPTPKQKIVIM